MPAEWLNLPFAAAVRFLRSLKPTPRETFDTMTEEARQSAFTVSRLTKLEAIQSVLDTLAQAAESGMTLAEFSDQMEPLGLTEPHVETIYRTNLQSSFGRGRFEQLVDPTISSAIWGWRYKTVGDERVREEHAVLNGLTFATGAHDEVFPPWGFNCRCGSEVITTREARLEGITSTNLPAEAQQALGETDFASPALGVPFTPDLAAYDIGLVAQFINDQAQQ